MDDTEDNLLWEEEDRTPSRVTDELEGCDVCDDGLAEEQCQDLFGESSDEDSLAFKLRKQMVSLGATKQKKRNDHANTILLV